MTIVVEIDTAVDAGYIRISGEQVASSSQYNESIVVDLDTFGRVVGIEVLELACPLPVTDLSAKYHMTDEAIAVLRRIRPSIESLTARSAAVRPTSSVRRSRPTFREVASA